MRVTDCICNTIEMLSSGFCEHWWSLSTHNRQLVRARKSSSEWFQWVWNQSTIQSNYVECNDIRMQQELGPQWRTLHDLLLMQSVMGVQGRWKPSFLSIDHCFIYATAQLWLPEQSLQRELLVFLQCLLSLEESFYKQYAQHVLIM